MGLSDWFDLLSSGPLMCHLKLHLSGVCSFGAWMAHPTLALGASVGSAWAGGGVACGQAWGRGCQSLRPSSGGP